MTSDTLRVKGSRYFVFNDDYYNGSGGLLDCELITDDIKEAEQLSIKLSKNEFYPEQVGLFDVKNKKYYVYINGKKQDDNNGLMKFV